MPLRYTVSPPALPRFSYAARGMRDMESFYAPLLLRAAYASAAAMPRRGARAQQYVEIGRAPARRYYMLKVRAAGAMAAPALYAARRALLSDIFHTAALSRHV